MPRKSGHRINQYLKQNIWHNKTKKYKWSAKEKFSKTQKKWRGGVEIQSVIWSSPKNHARYKDKKKFVQTRQRKEKSCTSKNIKLNHANWKFPPHPIIFLMVRPSPPPSPHHFSNGPSPPPSPHHFFNGSAPPYFPWSKVNKGNFIKLALGVLSPSERLQALRLCFWCDGPTFHKVY